jgi:hypothetical protein
MRPNVLAFAIALSATALAAPAGASLSGFRLPGQQPQQTPPPDLQGPVAPDVPASRRGPTPTPTPTATASRTESPAAQPVEVPTGLEARPGASPTRRAVAPAPTSAPASTLETATALPEPVPAATPSAVAAGPAPIARASTAPAAAQGAGWSWLWWLVAIPLVLAALVLAGWVVRRRVGRPLGPVAAPRIERPRVGPAPDEPRPAPAEPLQVSLEPLRLSLTLMNATLAYRLELTNRGAAPLTGLAIGADMIAAHASMSREEQLAGPQAGSGAPLQRIERLEPGETRVVEGEFRLPFPQIVPIRLGNAALLLPLARFRVEAEGAQPLVRTFVVGQPGQGSSLQPFRLDQGPRVYPRLAQHAFA